MLAADILDRSDTGIQFFPDHATRLARLVLEEAEARPELEDLARFLLEHDHCGDDEWGHQLDRRKDWYRSLAGDVLAFLASPSKETPDE